MKWWEYHGNTIISCSISDSWTDSGDFWRYLWSYDIVWYRMWSYLRYKTTTTSTAVHISKPFGIFGPCHDLMAARHPCWLMISSGFTSLNISGSSKSINYGKSYYPTSIKGWHCPFASWSLGCQDARVLIMTGSHGMLGGVADAPSLAWSERRAPGKAKYAQR